ncbi:unnamed protein product [Phytophthora fragariaefolia]|uniref:Unnamed protein product n=1 Tax=Phytophthora fragariaefolia TaxID=1490495 RepID=A0A9W6UAM4_9STRA|nr:unnamed protein product [Phytophthora fragariaefolia]
MRTTAPVIPQTDQASPQAAVPAEAISSSGLLSLNAEAGYEVMCSSAVRRAHGFPLPGESRLSAFVLWQITGFRQMTCDLAKSPTPGGG